MLIADHNPVSWFEIYVQDMDRAKAFYEKTLGVTMHSLDSPGPTMLGFPMLYGKPGGAGALVKMDGKAPGEGGTLIYFFVQDCGPTADAAEANGGKIHVKRRSIGQYGFISLVLDTEGNLIGLHSME